MPSAGYLFGAKSCHCGCEICPHCSASCLSVTFADWSGTGEGCDCGDLNGTYLLTRGKGRRVAINVTTSTGSGAILWAVLGWNNETATHFIADVDIEDGGVDHDPGDTASVGVDSGEVVCEETPGVELTIESGVIVSAEVVTPGKLVLNSTEAAGEPCVYSRCDKLQCGETEKSRTIAIEVTETERIITVAVDGVTIATGTIDAEDNPCGDMTFEPSDFTGDCTAGSVTVESTACDGPPQYCASCDCCVLINDRRTCDPGTSGSWPTDGYEAWGIGEAFPFFLPGAFIWSTLLDSAGGCGANGLFAVFLEIGECDPCTGETPIVVTSQQQNGDELCPDADHWGGRRHRWNGLLVKDDSGCPVGISLNEASKVTEYGVDRWLPEDDGWDSGIEPPNPLDYITFDCGNPLP